MKAGKMDLKTFLEDHQTEHIHISKPVQLKHVPALVAQAEDTIVFDQIEGFPQFRLVDQLFINRRAQARILGCKPSEVVKQLTEIIRKGPSPLRNVKEALVTSMCSPERT